MPATYAARRRRATPRSVADAPSRPRAEHAPNRRLRACVFGRRRWPTLGTYRPDRYCPVVLSWHSVRETFTAFASRPCLVRPVSSHQDTVNLVAPAVGARIAGHVLSP